MKNLKGLALVFLSMCTLYSCEKCKECYILENVGTPNEQTTELGEKCGDELDDLDGREYLGNSGGVKTYCD